MSDQPRSVLMADHSHDRERVVLADGVYTLDEIRRRLRLGQAALRTARRGGLIVRQIGRCRFVLGKDLISYLEQQDP
jgi:hypothetical protein